MEQDQASAITFASSEESLVDRRPKLEITYVTLDGSASVTIQRPGADQDGVADAYIWELVPNSNGGNSNPLYAGLIMDLPKQSLVRFELEFCEQPGGCRFTGGGVDTDGNWDHKLEDGEMIRNGAGSGLLIAEDSSVCGRISIVRDFSRTGLTDIVLVRTGPVPYRTGPARPYHLVVISVPWFGSPDSN